MPLLAPALAMQQANKGPAQPSKQLILPLSTALETGFCLVSFLVAPLLMLAVLGLGAWHSLVSWVKTTFSSR
jgi:type II secretory pathway component PulJ